MYRFIQNIGDYFNPGYFTDDFKDSVFKEAGFDNESLKELNKRFSDLRHQYYDVFKKEVIDGNLPMRYVLKKMHDFNTKLLQMLGYNTADPYVQWLYLDIDRVVPVRHIFRNGTQPQLLVMEMQPMLQMGDQPIEGLFDQYYESESEKEQRYRYTNWQNVTTLPIPEGCKISPKIINQAIEEIFYLPEEQRPKYVLVLAGNRIYLLEEKKYKHGSYLVFDIEELISEAAISASKDYYTLFYLLCGREVLANESQTALMDKLNEASTRNAYAVTKDLKEGVITAVESLANEAIYYIHEVLSREQDETNEQFAQNVKDDCITIVYRLLFIFYAEARPDLSILPMNDEVYVNGYSLDKLRDLETVQMQNQSTKDGYFIHDSLWRLFQMIHMGYNQEALQKTFSVKKIDSPLFDDSKLKTLQNIKYRNSVWQKIIYALSISKPDGKRQPGRISYINLGINQLGSVYESLLAYRGFYAEQDYIEIFKAGAEKEGTFLVPASRMDDYYREDGIEIKWESNGDVRTYKKGTFVYRLNGRDRQKSASYYTPEVLTQSTVKYTLKGFVDRLKDPNDDFHATDLLSLKILEPAMGAAAFQNEVINQLADLYITYREKEKGKHISPMERRNEVQKVKAYIATHNVYGVDLNPTAIELGKLSLWLNVIHKDMETPFFSNRLALGNAVIGAWLKVYSKEEVYRKIDVHSKNKKKMPNPWWETAPHKVKFFKNKVNRLSGEVYHFLLPDKNMLAVRSIPELKKQNTEKVTGMNKMMKDWLAPIDDEEFNIILKLSTKIDILLKEYYQFQQSVEGLTQNKMALWGIAGNYQTETFLAEKYETKEKLNDIRYRHDNAYFRLKMIMDYWCSLWFWEYDDADSIPTRREYWADINAMLNVSENELNANTTKRLQRVHIDKNGQLGMFPEGQMNDMFMEQQYKSSFVQEELPVPTEDEKSEIIKLSKEEILTEVQGDVRSVFDDSKRFKIVAKYAKRYNFFHPMLEFLEVFWLRDGFDIICGNPPFLKWRFEAQDVISEKYPEVVIKDDIDAAKVEIMQEQFLEDASLKCKFYSELIEVSCMKKVLNATCLYPVLKGQQTDLFKCIFTNSLDMQNPNGYMGLIHPNEIFDEAKGQILRQYIFPRLKYRFQYQNALPLFSEVEEKKIFDSVVYYGSNRSHISFDSINNLFHPSTIDGCYNSDGQAPCGPKEVIDHNGRKIPNLVGHKHRIIHYDESVLKIVSRIFEEDADWQSCCLVSLHTDEILNVVKKIDNDVHVSNLSENVTFAFDATNSVKDKTIKKSTKYPELGDYEMIFYSAQINLLSPFSMAPHSDCDADFTKMDTVNYRLVNQDFVVRTNYVPNIPINKLKASVDPNNNWLDSYKIGYRKMLDQITSERTLRGAILPPKSSHTNSIISVSFKNESDMLIFAGLSSSIVYDFYIRVNAAKNLTPIRLQGYPYKKRQEIAPFIISRVLRLNCVNKWYKELWERNYIADFVNDSWSINDSRLSPFHLLKPEYSDSVLLRNEFERRQALIEIDVLSAMSFNLSLEDLLYIHNMFFPIARKFDETTWYDSAGEIVFTTRPYELDLDRSQWEEIRGRISDDGMRYEGVSKTYTYTIEPQKSELYGGQSITYIAPFTRCDRIEDYRHAWTHFEMLFNNK